MEEEKELLKHEINTLEYFLYLFDEHGYVNDSVKIENISPRIELLRNILEFVEKWESK